MQSQTLKIEHARYIVTLESFVDEGRLFARVQEIGERLQARTGVTFPRSRWPIV